MSRSTSAFFLKHFFISLVAIHKLVCSSEHGTRVGRMGEEEKEEEG